MKILLVALSTTLLTASGPIFHQADFSQSASESSSEWRTWSPRPENASRAWIDDSVSHAGSGSLAMSGNSNLAVLDGWVREVDGIKGGQWYRFVAHYRTVGVTHEARQVLSRLDWADGRGRRTGHPEYAFITEKLGDWTRVSLEAPAPPEAAAVRLQLLLWDSPTGTVWWDDISLSPIPAPAPREVRVASVNLRPQQTKSAAESVAKFIETIDKKLTKPVDLIVLPEGITVVGTGKKYAEVAEPIPGPTTEKLGEVARAHNAYIAAGIYEKEGVALYNTAVLLDRAGKLVGRYRKVYIPREETEGGISPGSDYPVFKTDFGKVGMMICWDSQYADPARALTLRGAEMLLLPIWGGNMTLTKARAIENQVFVVSSGYDFPTQIIDPAGEVIAVASEEGTVAVATVDLNKRYMAEWLGYMRARFYKELRLDIPVLSPEPGR